MDLRKILAQVLKEDAPIGGTQPAPQPSAKLYNVLQDFQTFETTIDKQTEAAKKTLEASIEKNIGRKKITVRASKGAMGQVEKDYTIDVKKVSITMLKEDYFIVLIDADGKEYYVNTAFKIKVVGDATPSNRNGKPEQPNDQKTEPQSSGQGGGPNSPGGPRSVGGLVHPQNMGIAAGGPNTLSPR